MSHHLPVIGSTAATTAFVHHTLDIGSGRVLYLDGNAKITAGNGTFEAPAANALSIRSVDDCPGSTPACRASCYVHGLRAALPSLYALYEENSRTLHDLVDEDTPYNEQFEAAAALAGYIVDHCQGGFRWHVSGDVFSQAYAKWIASVVFLSASTSGNDPQQWIYTRSFEHLPALVGHPNLTVNLSADNDNLRNALFFAELYGLRVCFMSTDGQVPYGLVPGDVVFPDYAFRRSEEWLGQLSIEQRRMVCPVDFFGKSKSVRCGPCRKCIDNRKTRELW